MIPPIHPEIEIVSEPDECECDDEIIALLNKATHVGYMGVGFGS